MYIYIYTCIYIYMYTYKVYIYIYKHYKVRGYFHLGDVILSSSALGMMMLVFLVDVPA